MANISPTAPKIAMGPMEQTAYFALVRAGRKVATAHVLSELLGLYFSQASRLLFRLKTKGAAQRVGKGKYAVLAPEVLTGERRIAQDSLVVASELMKVENRGYAVGYASAAYLHGLLTQIPQVTQIAVTQRRRNVKLGQIQVIDFITVLPKKFFGIQQVRYFDVLLTVTDVEKTVIDCLDRLDLCGGLDQAAQVVAAAAEKMDPRKLVQYARQIGNSSLVQRLGYILDRWKLLPQAVEMLGHFKHRVPGLLDPSGPRKGRFNPRWNLLENTSLERET